MVNASFRLAISSFLRKRLQHPNDVIVPPTGSHRDMLVADKILHEWLTLGKANWTLAVNYSLLLLQKCFIKTEHIS